MNNGENRDPKLNDQIALYILTERLNELKETHKQKESRDMELFQQITNNQKILSERLLIVETNQQFISETLIKLQREASVHTKILSAIFIAAIGPVIKLFIGV